MAKKNEFRPDKPRTSLLSHLVLTPKQQRTLLKWSLYGALLLVISVVQDVILSQVRLFGATTELIPCAIFLIAVLEGAELGNGSAACELQLLLTVEWQLRSLIHLLSKALGVNSVSQAVKLNISDVKNSTNS